MARISIWSPEEDQLIKEYYPVNYTKDILSFFPGKSYQQISNRAKRLGIRKDQTMRDQMSLDLGIRMSKEWKEEKEKNYICKIEKTRIKEYNKPLSIFTTIKIFFLNLFKNKGFKKC